MSSYFIFFATLDSHVATFVAPLNDIGKICFEVWATPNDCHCEERSDAAIKAQAAFRYAGFPRRNVRCSSE